MTDAAQRRLSRLCVAVTIIGAALPGLAADAAAWSEGPCPTAAGVTVVVDFQDLGGGVHVRCAPGSVDSGFQALQQAGIDYQTAVRFSGFLCKIAGKPVNDPCVNTSPATAYWSYWLAPRGGQWCYSNWGAGNRTPPQGTVEGWSFSLDRTGSAAPPPRVQVPGPVAGAPAALPGGDCDQRGAAPSAPPSPQQPVSPAPTAPPPVVPSAPSPAGDSPQPDRHPDVPSPGAGVSPQAPNAESARVPDASDPPGTVGDAAGDSSSVSATDDEAGATSAPPEDTARRGADTSTKERPGDELAGTVELSTSSGNGSPVAVLATLATIAGLVAAGVMVRRRDSSR